VNQSTRVALAVLAGIAVTTAGSRCAVASSKLERGSGRMWRSLYAQGRDGTGPPNITLQVSTPARGGRGFRLSLFEDDPPHTLIWSKEYPEDIQFTKLEVHANPINDIWEEGDHSVKQFPHLLFVGHGMERGRPVTLVWEPGEEGARAASLVLKVFRADASALDGLEHGKKGPGGILIERAIAGRLPAKERPKWAKRDARLKRVWTYQPLHRFVAGPWKRSRRLQRGQAGHI
jgi:hypothetical protein